MFRTTVATLLVFAFQAIAAEAASITNSDSTAYTLVVTEGSQQTEVGIAPGQSIDICSGGCFVTMPNGDREALTGNETVDITGGKAIIK